MVLTARAYAKINLGLKVCRRRPDGYHDICTIFQQIDLADELAFEVDREAGAIGLLCEGAELPVDERNLVMKAALRLADRVPDKARRTLIVLRKRIPVGGGLGGGSSDAATTLRVLNRAWGANLPEAELLRMARGLGADVPFFLQGGAAFATGIGDVLTPIALWVDPVGVLIVPDVQVSTAWAYGQLKIGLTKRGGCGKFRSFLRLRPPLREWHRWLENDFERVVFERFPEVAGHVARLREGGAEFSGMSGSGACVFGLFGSEEGVRVCEGAGWRSLTFRLVSGRESGAVAAAEGDP